MFSKISSLIVLLALVGSAPARASMDPSESPGLRHLFYRYGGLFLLDFDMSHKLINQTDGGDRLVLDTYQSGFRLQQNVSTGLGTEFFLHVPTPTGVTVGLDLLAGTNASFDRFVQSRDRASSLGAPTVPFRATDLRPWTIGDNVMYLARGGVGFAAGVGIPPFLGAAAYYFVEGDWFVYVEKTDATHVYVKLTSTKSQSMGALASGTIVGVDVAAFGQTDQTFSFSYDLNNTQARNAYEDALRGSLAPSQRLADAKTGSVLRVLSAEAVSYGTVGSWYLGVPFLSTVGGKTGDIFSRENTIVYTDGSQSLVQTGIFIDHGYSAGLLSKHKKRINDFFGSAFTRKDEKGTTTKGYSGQYFWAFESDGVSPDQLGRELGELAAKTGLNSVKSITLPNTDRLGYLNIKFNAELSQQTVDALMSWATSSPRSLVGALGSSGTAALESYFHASVADPNELCSEQEDNGIVKALDLDSCKSQLLEKTTAANSSIVNELRAMAQVKNTNQKEFALHFGRFGKGMATNQFTFREMLDLTQSAPVKMTLSMEGERISRFKKAIPATASSFQAE